jgi:molybdopterin-guanine dinucleotide biosynthesis protein A
MPSAAILAGGRAERFDGRDKGTLLVGGRTIIERQVDVLSRLTDDILLVGSNPLPDTRKVDGRSLRVVPDRVPGCGPLAGLDAALAACRSDTLVVLACDMPFVSSPLVAHLAALAETPGGPWAVVPKTARGCHPLCAVYTRACQTAVARLLAEHRFALMELLDELRRSDPACVRVVADAELEVFGDPSQLLANVNTPTEYEELEALYDHRR